MSNYMCTHHASACALLAIGSKMDYFFNLGKRRTLQVSNWWSEYVACELDSQLCLQSNN